VSSRACKARVSALAARAVLAAPLAFGCGTSSLAVPSYPHPIGAAAEAVAFMPPPAQIEHLDSKPPARGCLWADGQWIWAAQRWDWRPGAWVRPPEGCRYSAPTVQWAPSDTAKQGILYYRPGRWYSVSEPKACAEAVICPTQSLVPAPHAEPSAAPIGS
jgi:hypothetical protein